MAEYDDLRLIQDIEDELRNEPAVNTESILATVHDGVVTLRGTAATYHERIMAERAALRVAGVRAIVCELTVELPEAQRRDDEDLADAAAHALRWNAAVPEGIRAVVRDGWVTLQGDVSWDSERVAAERTVSMLIGVAGVTNEIRVRRQPTSANLQAELERALRRSALVGRRRVAVHVLDSRVTLRGTVRSWAERFEAQRIAWTIAGVTDIDNQITVGVAAHADTWGPVLDRIEGSRALPRDVDAADAARAVLCALSSRVSREEALRLAGSLPAELGSLVHPCIRHRREEAEAFDRPEFLRRVAQDLRVTSEEADRIACAVVSALKDRIPADEVQQIGDQLPGDLKELWQRAA